MTPEEFAQMQNEEKSSGERLAVIETMLKGIADSVSDLKSIGTHLSTALNSKVSVEDFKALEKQVDDLEKWKNEQEGERKATHQRMTRWMVILVGSEVFLFGLGLLLANFLKG